MIDECPFCGFDDAYYDIDHWYCPRCEKTWKIPLIGTGIKKYMIF